MPNHLAAERSLYLRQHADNPVDWYPWGDDALTKAQAEDKPLLLSIGYSACHWCHVMAHESFENPAIAAQMNADYVCIKVDREERPDIDTIYMEAVQALTGGGGWPLTVFLLPDGRPFYGGTYFPPSDRAGMPGFPRVLSAVAEAYRTRRGDLLAAAQQIAAVLTRPATGTQSPTEPLAPSILRQAYAGMVRAYDQTHGGFGRAPKFPQPLAVEFLLRYYYFSGDASALAIVSRTLQSMAAGGIYDHLGGGFHRYSTDERWLAPHFEKMLYDNALLARLYLHAYLASGEERFQVVASETLDFILRELRDPSGGFYSTLDADSEGVEGQYYLWTLEEATQALGAGAAHETLSYFDITAEGNFEGRNILHSAGSGAKTPAGLAEDRARLLVARQQRVRPSRDEKALAGWNGLALAAVAEAAAALDRPDYREAAEACGSFLLDRMGDPEWRLWHTYQGGEASVPAFLEDYASTIDGLLALHAVTLSGRWLEAAIGLAKQMVQQFWDESRGFYDTGPHHETLVTRPRSVFDGATPSGPSAATYVMLRLALITGHQDWSRIAATSLRSLAEPMRQQPLGYGHWLCALDFYLSQPQEIAIVGRMDDPVTRGLVAVAHRVWGPNRVVAGFDLADAAAAGGVALLEGKGIVDGKPTAYLCQGYHCQAPANDPEQLQAQMVKS